MSDEQEHSLILASASPRRRELLTQIGVAFTVQSADIDESLIYQEKPTDYVRRLSKAKAQEVATNVSGARYVLGADTVVVIADEVLGKPKDADNAKAMLARLSGREHQVLTAVALVDSTSENVFNTLTVATTVRFRRLSDSEIKAYVRCGEPMDKAGAYGIQGLGGALVETISGSYSNVVGLPLAETFELLTAAKLKTGLST